MSKPVEGVVYDKRHKDRRVALYAPGGKKVTHGLESSYKHYGCRCVPCTRAHSEHVSAQRERRRATV